MSSSAPRPLLVLDGDSLAHRAYHALPKTFRRAEGKPGNALLGFSNFLTRLWQSEQPRAVIVGWDSLDTPTYRHELFEGYQGGRVFDDDLLEQLDLLPGARARLRVRSRKGAGLRGGRLPRGGSAQGGEARRQQRSS